MTGVKFQGASRTGENPTSGSVYEVKPRPPRSGGGGFTLIELLVVIGILSLLAGLLFPAIKAVRGQAALTKCASNLRQISLALELYANAYEDSYPMAVGTAYWGQLDPSSGLSGWMERIVPYVKDPRIYRCPGQPSYLENEFSYFLGTRAAFVATGGRAPVSRKSIQLPSQYILAGDSTFWFDMNDTDKDNYSQDCLFTSPQDQQSVSRYHAARVNILFGDGHVKSFREFVPGEMTYAFDRPGINWDGF